jgi:sugar/nucleoside kinase (ribokinase family)
MSIVVTGYASLDYAVRVDTTLQPDRTATILSRPAQWPRLGGSPSYVAAALAASGAGDAAPISWVGDDAEGERYRKSLEELGVRTDGIAVRPGRTPVCVLSLSAGRPLLLPLRSRTDGIGRTHREPTCPAARGGGDLRHRRTDKCDPGGASSGAT